MDKLKTRVLFIALIILALVSVSAVAAADSDEVISDTQDNFDLSEETNDVEQLGANAIDDTDSNDPLTAGEPGNFTDLQDLIDDAGDGDIIELDKDYVMSNGEKPLFINKTLTIDGKGFTLDANHLNATLVAMSKISLKDIVFINGNCTEEFSIGGYYARGTVNVIRGSDGSTIDNCTFKDNAALMGGGVYWTSKEGTITNTRFENNVAMRADSGSSSSTTSQGGAIYWSGANGKIDNCNFTKNSASYSGGAIYYQSANNQSIENSYFYQNVDNRYGEGAGGGAIYFSYSSNARIVNSNFTENSVKGSGGAIYIDKNSKNQSIKDSSFTKNNAEGLSSNSPGAPTQSYGGGAIFWRSTNGTLENVNFTENFANVGGAVYYTKDASNQSITDSLFSKNSANQNGATGISAYAIGGGGIYGLSSNVTIEKSNFTENWANASGGAIFFSSAQNLSISDASFTGNEANSTGAYTGGGAICYSSCKYGSIENVNFTDNYARQYGGAVHFYKGNNQSIVDSSFSSNVANSSGGAVCYYTSTNGSIENVNFTENSAKTSGGAIYYTNNAHNQSIVDSSFSNNIANSSGGAIYYSSSNYGSIENSNFTENSANSTGGAIYYSSSNNATIENVNFTDNAANTNGGAIYTTKSINMSIADSSFSKNNASSGGAIYSSGSNSSLEKVNFTDNLAKTNGGAIYLTTTNQSIAGSTFNGNNATSGSAIYHNSGSLNISSTELLENQAKAASLTASAKVEGFDATISTVFKGNDNLLNSIYTKVHTNVRLTDVSYWGAEDKMNTGASEVTPVASADESEDGTLVYKDDREAGINITVTITDANGNFIKNVTGKTDIYGNINISNLGLTPGKYKAKAIHEEDNYYTEIVSKEFKFEILKANSTVNGTDETEVYKNPVVVTVASENATAVIYNITDSEGTVVVVPDTSVDANGTFTVPVNLDVGEYTVNYKTVVDEEYYNINTNSSKITITPAPSSVNAEDVEKVYGEEITVTVASENATQVTYNITNSEGTVVVANTTVDANGEFTVPVALDVGEYTVTLTTIVDGNHMTNTNTSKITITPAPSSVNAEDVEKVYGEEITVTVASENATQVTYNITNSEGTVVVANTTVDANGEFTVPVALDVGEYTVTLTTIVDGNHMTNTNTSKITITPAPSSVNAEDVEKVYGEEITVTVASENATQVTYNITNSEGTVVVANTTVDANGEFTVPVALDVGEYTVTLTTIVDGNHMTNTNTSKITITPAPSSVNAEDVEKVYGEEITVTVASENATQVTYNITNSEGTVVVANTTVDANGEFTVPVALDVGEYTVTLTTIVDGNHMTNTNTSKITITPAPSSVNAEDVEKVYGEEITVTVASENATQVTYNITNSEGTVVVANTTVDANGEFTVPVALDVGEYTVTLTTIVDGNHMTNTNTSKITITPAPSSVNAEDVEKVYGEEITVTVASENATQVTYNITNSEGTVVVANTTVDANGEFTVPVALDVGEYTVTLTTIVDGNHISNTSTSKITITPAASSISAEDVEKVYSDDVVLIASGDNSTGINESTVVVRDAEGNIVDATVTVSDDFTITIIGLDAGEYKVSYTNTVDKNHITSSNVTNVVVLKIDTAVSNESASDKPGKKVTVDFTVDDQKGNPVHNGNLTVTVDGKEYVVNVTDGKATFKDITLPDTPGNYSYDVSYSGEDNYNPSVGQLNLTVQKVDVIVTLPEVINYTGAVVDIVVDVIDEYGNPVNEGTVNLVIDFGTKLSNKLMATALSNTAEVSNGKAVFKDITLGEPGKYPSYAQYSGSDYYNEAENTSDVIVLPLNTTTESQDVSGHSGDKKDITADIVDQNGNPVKNGTAVLKVNGKEYTAEVKDGKAIFKNVELPSESTDATIDYLGNEYYNPSSTTIKITISEDEEQEGGDEPINGTEDKTSTANAVKAVSVLPSTGNPIALVILALLTLVSTVSLGNKK